MGRKEKKVAGSEGLVPASGPSLDHGDKGKVVGSGQHSGGAQDDLFHLEMLARGDQTGIDVGERRRKIFKIDREEGLFKVKLAGFSVEANPVPVEGTVGGVAVLLDFDNEVALADGVEASAGNKNTVAFPGR